jgi:hypothetical protein
MSFANLKRDRGQINKLVAAAEAVGGGASSNKYTDDRLWKPTVDKQNNGYAIIRFLPATEGAELPWIRFWDHGFKGPTGKWYIEKSLTSIGQEDPVGELNSRLWNSGIEADKETARAQKRRLHHVSNILVVSDPGNPANEGKVFLYNYGKKIFDKFMDAWSPEFADETPMNPFCMWEGADFKLKIRDVEGYRNYDKSEFASQEALSEDDDKLESIYNSMHDLNVYAKDGYKSYAELKTKLMSVLGEAAVGGAPSVAQERSLGEERSAPPIKSAPAPEMSAVASSDDDDDIMSHFANLVND